MRPTGADPSSAESGETLRGELAGGVVNGGGEARQRPSEVAPGIDALKLAGAEDGIEHGGAPAGIGMADEKEILFPTALGLMKFFTPLESMCMWPCPGSA